VIETAAKRANWQPTAAVTSQRGRGFAFAKYKNLACYCALAADVAVDPKTGRVSVNRVVAAVDAGQIVNPDGVINQIEGGIIQSASWTLMESVRFDQTRVTTRSWADYPDRALRRGARRWRWSCSTSPTSGSWAWARARRARRRPPLPTASRNATGKRLRALPFTPERVKQQA
jgi:CO/xanthine dehydrogenase Mo-binding subunit